MREQLGDRLPSFTEQEFKLLKEAEVDFYGMNYYTCQFARHRSLPALDTDYVGNVDELQENKAGVSVGEQAGIWWLYSVPEGFRKHLWTNLQEIRKDHIHHREWVSLPW